MHTENLDNEEAKFSYHPITILAGPSRSGKDLRINTSMDTKAILIIEGRNANFENNYFWPNDLQKYDVIHINDAKPSQLNQWINLVGGDTLTVNRKGQKPFLTPRPMIVITTVVDQWPAEAIFGHLPKTVNIIFSNNHFSLAPKQECHHQINNGICGNCGYKFPIMIPQ